MIRYRYNARQALTKILAEIAEEVEDSDSELLDWESEDDSVEFADRSNANEADREHDDAASLPQTDILPSATECLVDDNSGSPGHSDAETEVYSVGPYDHASDAEDLLESEAVMTSKCGTIQWSSKPHRARRLPPWNVMTEESGVPESVEFEAISDAFRTFIDEQMTDLILRYTNAHAAEIKLKSQRFNWNNDLSVTELEAFIGLLILAGVQRCKNQALRELWDEQWGFPVFRTTMSYNRFIDILRALRFDDQSTRQERVAASGNQGAAVHEMLQIFSANCRSSYRCGPSVTIDEQLVTFHGNCRFRVYIPTKPGKYGMKVWIMADSETFYCGDLQLYAGRVGSQQDVGQGSRVVLDLSTSIVNTGRNITTDNFFTSYRLAQELMQRRLSLVGTVRSNRKEIPPSMQPDRSRPACSSVFGFSSDGVTMVSYVPKPRKAVILLSSQHRDTALMDDDKRKPHIIEYYNQTKAGVDILDKLVRTYSCRRSTRRWTVALFFNIVDIAAVNALILWVTKHPDWNQDKSHVRRLFLCDLGMQLVNCHVQQRMTSTVGKRRRLQDSARQSGFVVGTATVECSADGDRQNQTAKRKGRCVRCPRKVDRKVARCCSVCNVTVCEEHSITMTHCVVCSGSTATC